MSDKKTKKTEYFYGCKATGMVCSEMCVGGCSNCKNSVIFKTLEEALEAGYRQCIRCQPGKITCSKMKERLIRLAKEYLEEHYAEKFAARELASHLHINEDYLGRVFKSSVGETPLRYHNFVRCEYARELLETSDYSVELVSCQVGYLSESHFIKLFKSFYGETPLRYRKNHRNKVGIRIQTSEKKVYNG